MINHELAKQHLCFGQELDPKSRTLLTSSRVFHLKAGSDKAWMGNPHPCFGQQVDGKSRACFANAILWCRYGLAMHVHLTQNCEILQINVCSWINCSPRHLITRLEVLRTTHQRYSSPSTLGFSEAPCSVFSVSQETEKTDKTEKKMKKLKNG